MIIKNCAIITQNKFREIIPWGFLRVEGDRISKIGRGEPDNLYLKEKTINLNGNIVMPGLINAHCHLGDLAYGAFGRSIKSPAELLQSTDDFDLRKGRAVMRQKKHLAALKTLKIFQKQGITTVAGGMGAEEAAAAGMRFLGGAMLKKGRSVAGTLRKIENYSRRYFCRPGLLLHSLLELSAEQAQSLKKYLKNKQFAVMIHLAEFPKEKAAVKKKYSKERIEVLGDMGLLSPKIKLIVVHANFLGKKEVAELTKHNAGLVLCPANNKHFKFPLTALASRLKKAVATDGPLTNPAMNLVGDALLCRKKTDFQKLFDFITIEAAEVLGLQDKIGSLEVGKAADLVVLDKALPKDYSRSSALGEVLGSLPGKIKMVMAGGKEVYCKK